MTRQLHSNEIRFDTLRGSGKNQPSRWQTDPQGRIIWAEPTSITVVWLFAIGALGLTVAWSMWDTNRLLQFGGTVGFAFDAVFVAVPSLTGLLVWLRAVQRAVARRSVVIDTQSSICTVYARTLATKTHCEHERNEVQIHVASLNHVVPARGFIGVTRTPRHHVVLITPTAVIQLEQYDRLMDAQSAAEYIANQIGIAVGSAYTDGVVSTLRAHFRAPF